MSPERAKRRPRSEALKVNGLPAPVEVRRHPSARRMTLRVSRTRRAVIVTLPMQCDLKQAGAFLLSHLDWVQERLGNIPAPQPFADGALIPLRGVPHRLTFTGVMRGARPVATGRDPNDQHVIRVAGLPDHAPRRLKDWLVRQARHDLSDRARYHAGRLGLTYKRIAVRDQVSRWGSCSSTGNLSFSWRLIMAPSPILDYVAAHEVAHLAEMNHGPNFWALVRQTCPDMDDARRWLDAYGIELHRYGAEI